MNKTGNYLPPFNFCYLHVMVHHILRNDIPATYGKAGNGSEMEVKWKWNGNWKRKMEMEIGNENIKVAGF